MAKRTTRSTKTPRARKAAPKRTGRVTRPAGKGRQARVHRKTKETDIALRLNVDGTGTYSVETGIPFLNHMLELFARHGFFDLEVKGKGDIEVDYHHTVEDVGLTLGQVLREALGDKRGIHRFGEATVPLDEALVQVVVDLSGRPYLAYGLKPKHEKIGSFDVELIHDFLLALSNEAGMNVHVNQISGRNPHHIIEAAFKGLARALAAAAAHNPRVKGVPSTKGVL